MSQYGGYGNPYYGGYFYPSDTQTPYYGCVQPDYVTGHAEGSGSTFHNFEDFQHPHEYPRIILNTKVHMISYMQDHARSDDDHRNFLVPENEYQVPTTTFPSGSYSIKGKESWSQDFGQSPHSEIQSLKRKERQYQDFEESLDGDKSKEKQTPLQGYGEIETDEDKILNPEIPETSPSRSGLRDEGLLKQHPLRDFDTVGELKQWAQDFAWSQGFALSAKSSKPNRNVYLKCSQGGVNLSKARSAERTGCKFEVSGRSSTRKNLWSLCPRLMQNTHNLLSDDKEWELITNLGSNIMSSAIVGILTSPIFSKKSQKNSQCKNPPIVVLYLF
ncbi:hypothetical protein BY996DRAFT_6494864 [Phakopsora pachyrhizi]|nr:hypothetical protein BY996DRAFT_6494864 [Phakopsora pachyrhizi]